MPTDRCAECKKKTGLLPFTCKCMQKFCVGHKNPEDHKCDFDHKACGISHLMSTLGTAVVADKMGDCRI